MDEVFEACCWPETVESASYELELHAMCLRFASILVSSLKAAGLS